MNPGVALLIMAGCLVLEAFFSGSEIGVISADRMKLRHEAAKGSRGARLALVMLQKPEWLLSTTLVGTNIAVVTNTTVATALMIQLFGEQHSWLAVVLAAPLIWVFGEVVPKSVFQQQADTLTPRVAPLLKVASVLFFPILVVFTALTRLLAWMLGGGKGRNPFTLRQEIVAMMETSEVTGDIDPVERRMIRSVFRFGETCARDIMVPLIDMVAVEQNATCGAARTVAAAQAHKRLPVYDGRIDRIIGVINALDLLLEDAVSPVAPHVRPAPYVPGAKSIEDLLRDFRAKGDNLAIVVDEFGGAEGMVTLEDLIEEVVGEIRDEYDIEEDKLHWVRRSGERDYTVSARVELHAVNEQLGLDLPDGNYETLGGFLLETAGDIPPAGALIRYRHIRFTVLKATATGILEVRVEW